MADYSHWGGRLDAFEERCKGCGTLGTADGDHCVPCLDDLDEIDRRRAALDGGGDDG